MTVSLNVAVLGEDADLREDVCKALAKKGTVDEIAFYNSVFQGKLVTCVDCVQFPSKVHSLVFALNLSNYCVLIANSLTPAVGETIVAADLLGKNDGCIVSNNPDQFAPFVKGTSLEGWKRFSSVEEAREAVLAFEPGFVDGPVKGVVDHAFEVKGVGSVALGVLLRGTMKVHDKLTAFPSGKAVEVRSIQKQDHDVSSAECWDRFGISMKGVTSAEVGKGEFLSSKPLKAVQQLEVETSVSKFVKEPLGKEGREVLHACVGLQVVPCDLEGVVAAGKAGKVKLVFHKPLAFDEGDVLLLLRLDAKGLRAVGSAKL
ncbi:hypothetical protein AUJ65_02135 [Candidatus Micrarchaeota archaeon CG1_02_51_15]|nr:MAG: hypothetical protein AUJ65_02135 [Candidatus Micrarchaeota archaeon CG1_02_51_15]